MFNISDYLYRGAENAKTGRYLCNLLNISSRDLTIAIETERRSGQPICASTNPDNPGYFLAANQKEMLQYCESLKRRVDEIGKTRLACLKTVHDLPIA